MPLLNNTKVNWAKIQEPERHKEYGDSWSVEVELSSAQVSQLTSDGLAGKVIDQLGKDKTPTGNKVIRLKRKTTGNKKTGGTFEKTQPRVVDSVKRPFTGLIGNGSVCNVAYNVTKSNFGISADFAGIQVLELVEFGGGGADAADEFSEVASDPQLATAVFDDDTPPF